MEKIEKSDNTETTAMRIGQRSSLDERMPNEENTPVLNGDSEVPQTAQS